LQVLPLQTLKVALQLSTHDFDGHDQAAPLSGKLPHPVPQAVQLPDALDATSQPSLLVASLSQSRCEPSHMGVHAEPTQAVAVAPEVLHTLKQAPQLSLSPETSVSQPSVSGALPAQSRKEPLHVHLQLAAPMSGTLHVGTPWPATGSQVTPQPPQLASVFTGVSQPSSGEGAAGFVQLPLPKLHVEVHRPPAQATVATPAREQARPQAPQLPTSPASSTQVELQQERPLHGLLQALQFIASDVVSTHSELQQVSWPGQPWLVSQPTVQTPDGLHSLPSGH
jgi:hypothetical protein